MTNDPSHTGVVDPSILSVDTNDLGIPSFLRRDEAQAPVFTTEVNEQGQTELTVENGDAALEVLNVLPEQVTDVQTAVSPEAVEEVVNNEALVSNAPSEIEKANEEPAHSQPPQHGANQPMTQEEMRRDFFKDVNKFGKASGEGASALGRLALRALRAAADGAISTAKPQGGGKDDATLIYEAYAAMDSKHSEHTAGGAKANASKLRQIIGMGCMTTLSDPVAVGDRAVRIRQTMEEQELKPKALFAALVDVARAQQASDTELSDDAIKEACTKTQADKSVEKEWDAIQKRVEKLVTGENSAGLKDQSDGALAIARMIDEHVKQFALAGQRNELVDALIDQGYTHAMAVSIVDKKL